MREIFEPVPLLVAAIAGATLFFLIANSGNLAAGSGVDTKSAGGTLLTGAAVGAGVQIAVRLVGVS